MLVVLMLTLDCCTDCYCAAHDRGADGDDGGGGGSWLRQLLQSTRTPGGDRLHNIASHRSFVRPFVCRVPPRTCRRTSVLCSLPITYYMYLCVSFRKYRTAISQAKCMFFFFVVSSHAFLVGSRSFSLPRTLFWLCFPLAIRKLTPAPGVLVIAP